MAAVATGDLIHWTALYIATVPHCKVCSRVYTADTSELRLCESEDGLRDSIYNLITLTKR